MKRRLRLRRFVPQDLSDVIDYFHQQSPELATRFVASYKEMLGEICRHPGRGSPKAYPSLQLAGFRSWSVPGFPKYLVLYRATDEAVIVYAIVHGARDIERLLQDRV